jgi:hypothetical protein
MSDHSPFHRHPPVGGSVSEPVSDDLTTDLSDPDPVASESEGGLAASLGLSAGRYQLLDEIARGGMGCIWRDVDALLASISQQPGSPPAKQ